ncbi:DUF6993 domain-containing protein [Microbacterium jiangjiandongii]|uniref:DUF6993 domain-containing protein n=1 Tax=Microbacterium jiangjiandongii TaxID=3049071 RepID=UPI00214BA94C|nr:hypothetical protein [Microbacterium sp. zg.Y843]MCR2814444.1 hypothetical protein [Microbacterium sp. zg.Y843]
MLRHPAAFAPDPGTVAAAVRRRPSGRRAARAALALAAALLLATACAPSPQPEPAPASPTAGAPTATEPEPAGPALSPDGSAADNLPLFTAVAQTVWASPQSAEGRAYIDALVAAGFDKAAMQVTEDTSTIGNAAESLQFAVQWGEDCLLGQAGPVTGTVVTSVAPALAGGGCLLGETRPIDW